MPKPTANMRQGGGAGRLWSWFGFDAPGDKARARLLVAASAQAARRPALYGSERVDDTFAGRFEMAALFAILLTRRLGREPDQKRLAQAVSNRVFSTFDEALREVGEGDLTVAKRMKGLARAFYGRLTAYEAVLGGGDAPGLASALARNVWGQDDAPFAAPLAGYVIALDAALTAAPLDALSDGAHWPAPDF